MNELSKIPASTADLRKSTDCLWKRLEDLGEQLDGLNSRIAKLESKEDWPSFCGVTFRAPGVANLHQAPERVQ
jgi:hypothetical protein